MIHQVCTPHTDTISILKKKCTNVKKNYKYSTVNKLLHHLAADGVTSLLCFGIFLIFTHNSQIVMQQTFKRPCIILRDCSLFTWGGGKNQGGGASNFCVARKGGVCTFLAKGEWVTLSPHFNMILRPPIGTSLILQPPPHFSVTPPLW